MIIGLTGGIGSGKSTVSKVFSSIGYPVFEADQAGRFVLENDSEVIDSVKSLFGSQVYKDGSPDRAMIARQVFQSKDLLEKLNTIIHPAVARSWSAWAANQSAKHLIREVAILFESGSYKDCDFVISVSAPKQLRVTRVVNRDGVKPSEVEARMKNQWNEQQRIERADAVILNDDIHAVIPQVWEIHERLQKTS